MSELMNWAAHDEAEGWAEDERLSPDGVQEGWRGEERDKTK